tara:strand:- start:89 stop:235 length:147 start_codon:yes stop_codon:yes gene_type:complete
MAVGTKEAITCKCGNPLGIQINLERIFITVCMGCGLIPNRCWCEVEDE